MNLCVMPIYADTKTTPSCKDVISACDKALTAKDAQITARDQTVSDLKVMSKKQADELQSANDKLNSWFRNPWLILAVGVGAGIYLGRK